MKELNAFIRKSTLNISVDNLDDLKTLIQNVKNKQDELNDAVNQLNYFDLKITFQQNKNVENSNEQKEEYQKLNLVLVSDSDEKKESFTDLIAKHGIVSKSLE